jgi:hypothetical protein
MNQAREPGTAIRSRFTFEVLAFLYRRACPNSADAVAGMPAGAGETMVSEELALMPC